MSICFHLPEDLVLKILIRLPVKSLIRFTCVSKRWRSIISGPEFRKSHLQLASQLRAPSVEKSSSSPSDFRLLVRIDLSCFPRDFNPWMISLQSIISHSHLRNMIVLGSCNGLILSGQRHVGGYRNLSIWNLSTGFFRKIPNPILQLQPMHSTASIINHGFGHVSACDDYKLVFIIPALGDHLWEVHMFSVRANIWKVITTPYWLWLDWVGGQGTFSNGAVHWVTVCSNESLNPFIYAFDLAEEYFRQVPLPHVLRPNERDSNCAEIEPLVHLGGSLCILSHNLSREKGEVWVMIEYGVPESWVKLVQFDLSKVPGDIPISYDREELCFITERGTMVIKWYTELYWIECHNEEKPICSRRYRLQEVPGVVPNGSFYCHATGYDETLVSIAE